jgi:hypothetical protein
MSTATSRGSTGDRAPDRSTASERRRVIKAAIASVPLVLTVTARSAYAQAGSAYPLMSTTTTDADDGNRRRRRR